MMPATIEDAQPDPAQAKPADPFAPPWLKRVPLITGGLAALAGFLTVRGADLSNDANYRSTQAVMFQAQASDKWAEYQADSIKRHGDENARMVTQLSPSDRARLDAEEKDFTDRQPKLKSDAAGLEARRDNQNSGGQMLLFQKNLGDIAGVLAQLGIALVSVAALTRKQAALTVGVLLGVAAVGLTGWMMIAHYLVHLPQ
jgi:hypothetical protein